MGITFDPRTGRYRGSDGRFIKADKVFELLEQYRIRKQTTILNNLENLNTEQDYDKYLKFAAKEIKQLHTINYIVGKGGVKQINDKDVKVLNAVLKDELTVSFDPISGSAYGLQELVTQHEVGTISQKEFVARLKSYTKGARKSYWVAVSEREESPYMRRFLHGDNNCSSCIEYAALGMVTSGSLPLPGFKCECRSNCNCTVAYYSERQYKAYLKEQIKSFADSVMASIER